MTEQLTLEQRIRRLEDRAEIIELTARYCRHVTEANKEAIVALYTNDGVFDRSNAEGKVSRGHTELLATYGNSGPNAFLPVIHNHVIELDGDEATGTCVVESPVRAGKPTGFVSRYEDKYRRVNGRWRFAERKVFTVMNFDA
jgi:hypothetical protein